MKPKAFVVELNDKPEYQRLLSGTPQTYGMKSGRVYLMPSQSCGKHSTEEKEELLIFLSGSGQAIVSGEECHDVGAGKVMYIGPHTEHDIKNTGSEPLIYIYCVAPAGP